MHYSCSKGPGEAPPLASVLTNSSSESHSPHVSSHDWAWKIHEIEAINIISPQSPLSPTPPAWPRIWAWRSERLRRGLEWRGCYWCVEVLYGGCTEAKKNSDLRWAGAKKVKSTRLKIDVHLMKLSHEESLERALQRFSVSCEAEEDRWKGPLLPHCSPQDTPFIPSLMMGWIYVFGSKSSDWMAESICCGVLLLFLGLWFYRNVTSGAGQRVKECTIRKWWFMWWAVWLLIKGTAAQTQCG